MEDVFEKGVGNGEMAQQLRALGILAEDPSLVPRINMVVHNHLKV